MNKTLIFHYSVFSLSLYVQECMKCNSSAKYWQTSMSYSFLDGYCWMYQVLISLLHTFFIISYCRLQQDSRVSLPASCVWCRTCCWTGESKWPVFYPETLFLSHAWADTALRAIIPYIWVQQLFYNCINKQVASLMLLLMQLLFIFTPTHVTWASRTLACQKVKKSASGLWKTIVAQLPKQHCRVTYYTGMRQSLKFQEEMGQKGELKVVGLLLRDWLQSYNTEYRLLSVSNKAQVNTTLLACHVTQGSNRTHVKPPNLQAGLEM